MRLAVQRHRQRDAAPRCSSRAFEPFFTTKPTGEGSGLGLATVYGIVNQAGGHVELYVRTGRRHHVRASAAGRAAGAPAEATASPRAVTAGGGETVLLVEDEEAMREVTRRILARHGYDVLTAADGEEALVVAREYAATDRSAADRRGHAGDDGTGAGRAGGWLRPGIRVLFMSGHARPILAADGQPDPDIRLVEKPFSESGLLGMVRQVLDEG